MSKTSKQNYNERMDRRTRGQSITREKIEMIRRAFVMSNDCGDSDIFYEFQKIPDETEDDDRFRFLWLVIKMKCMDIQTGEKFVRELHRRKVPLPDNVRARLKIEETTAATLDPREEAFSKYTNPLPKAESVAAKFYEEKLASAATEPAAPKPSASERLKKPTMHK